MTPDDARNVADVELGALPLIGQVNLARHRHPAVLDLDRDPMPRNREIPVQRVQDPHAHVFAMQLHLSFLLPP